MLNINMTLLVSLLGIGIILFALLKGKSVTPDTSMYKELETSLEEFMDEFEKENEYLMKTIQKLQNDLQNETSMNRQRIDELETKIHQLAVTNTPDEKSLPKTETTPAIIFNEHYSRVVLMMKEGRTPEQISKDTGIGLGEIQMIQSLVKQGNAV